MSINDLKILTSQLTDIGAFLGDLLKLDGLTRSGLVQGINLQVALNKISNDLQVIYDSVQKKIDASNEDSEIEELNI